MSSWPGARRTHVYRGLSNISLDSYLHKKVLLLLRDGRSFMGILRSFDHHSNAVLQGAFERVVVGHLYCDIPLGVFVVRGEEVILTGELGMEEERLSLQLMTRVSMAEIKRARKDEREAEDLKRKIGLGILDLD
ncbi:sm-like protein LSM1B [Alnus glutinosa]|uniref:sm-like protein LSM1B n=1 Tax=Alnus glutinosa TaxID=3517 RepID=UPI002D770206|nr:sm-like protein LSM1B [Alnus glutinosa]